MSIFNRLFGGGSTPISEILQQGATIIDVRTPSEFTGGHIPGSVNIPLNQLTHKLAKIKKMKTPLVLCCASGARSANATFILKNNDIQEVYNGGPWSKVHRLLNS